MSSKESTRLHVPLDTAYESALGRFVFCFARLEWIAVHCAERLSRGYIHTLRRKTAKHIAGDVLQLAELILDAELRGRFVAAAERFELLADQRNALLHANPGTDVGGEQRLFRHGAVWRLKDVERLADEVSACELELVEIFYNGLGGPL